MQHTREKHTLQTYLIYNLMQLEQEVCSLELAKRLKELGVKQESYFFYRHNEKGNYELCEDEGEFCHHKIIPEEHGISAFTVAELGELLPWYIESGFLKHPKKWLKIEKWGNVDGSTEWNVNYYNEFIGDIIAKIDSTEADARAKMLIYLLENNLCKNS